MEEGENKAVNVVSASQNQAPSISNHTVNGNSAGAGMTKNVSSPTLRGGSTSSDGFMGVAAMILNSKTKGKGRSKDNSNKKTDKHNGCDDDLPLGSEAHSLSLDYADSKYQLQEDKRSKWRKTASQGHLGWQSFNSDVSNQTSASSASLEQLLNERQVDPEEMLLSLGFGGESQSLMPSLARVPERFLQHPSRAYGITPTGLSEEDVEDTTDAAAPLPDKNAQSASTTHSMPPAKKRTGIWTLARTLSMLRLKTNTSRGHISSSSNSSGTHAHNNQLVSILHPANQKYLASRGFYEKQGWPKGSFVEPEDDSLHAVKEEAESRDAALKRKIFKKTRPPHNWSICDSEDNEGVPRSREWISKSMDDQSREDFVGDDSLGRGTYFSTTTESSTDSLDTPNLETERAFESIRREYEKNRQDRSSSDDLFLPSRKKRLSSEVVDSDGNLGLDIDRDLLSSNIASNNYFISPASSRQTTIEKAPTICDKSPCVRFIDDVNDDDNVHVSRSEGQSSDPTTKRDNFYLGDESGRDDVRIIISRSDNKDDGRLPRGEELNNKNGKVSGLTVRGTQTASSDSGSSSATAVESNSSTVSVDRSEPIHLNEYENIATELDSVSRTSNLNALNKKLNMVSCSSQTTDSDFSIATAVNQNISTSRHPTSNKSVLFIRINESEVSNPKQDRKGQDYAIIPQSPKVQLSTLPTALNHLELMKRLQQSQSELSRMGSVQSDSSGFGDTDPVLEPEGHKHTSLATSLESSKTLSSNAATVSTSKSPLEDTATQTLPSSAQSKTPHKTGVEAGIGHVKHNSKSTNRFVTMCYIPKLNSKMDQSTVVRHRAGAVSNGHHSISNQSKPPLIISPWRPRSDSEPYYPGRDPKRRWLRTNSNFEQDRHNTENQIRSVRAVNINPRPGVGLNTMRTHPQPHSGYADDVNKHTETHKPAGHNSTSGIHPRNIGSYKRTFTSQIDLFTHAHGVNSPKGTSDNHDSESNVGFRRYSDEGILEGRNNTPLSLEIAHAKTSSSKPHSSQHSLSRAITTRSSGLLKHGDSNLAKPTDSQTEANFQFSLIAGNISGLHSQHVSDKPIDSCIAPRSAFRQRSCDILDDDLDSIMTHSHSRVSDDFDLCSPTIESSSDLSIQSAPEGHIKTGILESRKLAKLINQPIKFMGSRRYGHLYHPHHVYKDWNILNKRKRLQEENRLLQAAVHKYKTELTVLEASLMVDCQAVYADMTDPEKKELEELEWLWSEVRGQVAEIEQILMARVNSVHAGNDLFSLMSGLGVIRRMIELIKEQICQQHLANTRTEEARDRSMDEDVFGNEINYYHDRRHHSFQGWHTGLGQMSSSRIGRRLHSSSTSNLSPELNMSLEQIKSQVLSQVQGEIKENTKKLEQDLQEKDREIKKLQEQLLLRLLSLPEQQPKRWTPRASVLRSLRNQTKSRSPRVTRKGSQETDV